MAGKPDPEWPSDVAAAVKISRDQLKSAAKKAGNKACVPFCDSKTYKVVNDCIRQNNNNPSTLVASTARCVEDHYVKAIAAQISADRTVTGAGGGGGGAKTPASSAPSAKETTLKVDIPGVTPSRKGGGRRTRRRKRHTRRKRRGRRKRRTHKRRKTKCRRRRKRRIRRKR